MTISQDKVGKLLVRSTHPEETEEILLAYCYSKWMNGGGQPQVLRKLHLLTLYLRAIDLGWLMVQHYQAFAIVASLTKSNARPVVILPTSELGLEAWNAARRPSKSVLKRVFEGRGSRSASVYGPTSGGFGSSESSDAELDATANAAVAAEASDRRARPSPSGVWSGSRTTDSGPAVGNSTSTGSTGGAGGNGGGGGFSAFMSGRRSRSNTSSSMLASAAPITASTTSPVLVVESGPRGDETRRIAGAGARDGLGRGFLSAPPNYDGNLSSYLASTPARSLEQLPPAHETAIARLDSRDSAEALPDYA